MAKKKVKEVPPTYDIYVVCDFEEDQTSDPDPSGESYTSRGDTQRTWTFKRLSGKNGHNSVKVSFKPVEGKTYYLLLSLNDSADSFGFDGAHYVEFYDIYETSEAANKAEQELMNCRSKQYIEYTNHQGKIVNFYNPWLGMFSGCDDIRVEYLVYHDI